MKNARLAATFVVSIVVIAAIAAGVIMVGDGSGNVKDVRGRIVSVPENPDKIVCLSAGSARLVSYFGDEAFSKIVGVDRMDAGEAGPANKYYMATYRLAYDVEDITNVGSEDSIKEIVKTGAEVIFSSKQSVFELDSLQEKTGIPVIGVAAEGNICAGDSMFDRDIELVGKVLGMEQRAKELCDGVDKIISELAAAKLKEKTECYVGGMFYMNAGGFYKTTGMYPSFNLIGAVNAMPLKNNGNPYDIINKELAEHSEIKFFFVDSMTLPASKAVFEADKEILKDVDAVKNGNIYSTFVYKYYGTNWESELMNAYGVGYSISPESFSDYEDSCKKILNLFYPDKDADSLLQKVTESQNGFQKLDW